MKRLHYFLLIGLLTAIMACGKNKAKPDLPPATQAGANTFGCYVDGKPYAIWDGNPKDDWAYPNYTRFGDGNVENHLYTTFFNDSPRWRLSISINLADGIGNNFVSAGIYPYISDFKDADGNGSIPLPSNFYQTNDSNYLTVHLTKSIAGKQYSGTFSGTMKNENGKVVTITDGRFDIGK